MVELPHDRRTLLKNGVYINILATDNCNPELCGKFFGCGIVEARFGSTQIDSLCVIDNGQYAVLNTNDCPYQLARETLEAVKKQYHTIDLLLVGYAGAGPFPQCFAIPDTARQAAAGKKKAQFLKQGEAYIADIRPAYYMPFAGTYTLGGKLAHLNEFRGVPELEEARDYYSRCSSIDHQSSKAILLNSYSSFDLSTGAASSPYQEADPKEKANYILHTLSKQLLTYEADPVPDKETLLPLIEKAYQRMEEKRRDIGFTSTTRVIIRSIDESIILSMDGSGYRLTQDRYEQEAEGYVAYQLDPRLFYLILRGPKFAHWNNAEIGSHITFERQPDIFERGLYHVMCYFHS